MRKTLVATAIVAALATGPAYAGFWSNVGTAFRDLGRQIAADWRTATSGHAVPSTGYRGHLVFNQPGWGGSYVDMDINGDGHPDVGPSCPC